MFNDKELRKAAAELNEVLGVNPPLNVKAKTADLVESVKEALELIDPLNDKFTKETMAVIQELGPEIYPTEEEKEEAEEVAEKLHKKNVASKSVRKPVVEEPEEEEEEEEEDEEPLTPSGKKQIPIPVKKPAPAKKTGEGRPANFKKEGSYAEYLDNLVKEGGAWDDLFTSAQQEAETRGKKIAMGTLKAHVKFRLSKDAKFLGKLKVTADGIE